MTRSIDTIRGRVVQLSTIGRPQVDNVEVTLKLHETKTLVKILWYRQAYESLGPVIFPALKTHEPVEIVYSYDGSDPYAPGELIDCKYF